MNTQRPKEGTKYRVCIDFEQVDQAVGFIDELSSYGMFGDRVVGARLADGLDQTRVREVLVRSMESVDGHPGQLLPLPQMEEGETPTAYRERLNHEQRAIFDAKAVA